MALPFADLEQRYGLPPGILRAVMQTESAGNPQAVSPAGAQGLFQFMPATAQQYGIDPFDPQQAATGAARFLADLNRKYQGDLPRVLAGYNWGQGNVDRLGLAQAPKETRDYIQKVTGLMGGAQVAQGRDFSAELFGGQQPAAESGRDFSAELFGGQQPTASQTTPSEAFKPEPAPFMAQVGRGMLDTYQGIKQLALNLTSKMGFTDPKKAEEYNRQVTTELEEYARNNPGFQFGRLLGGVASIPVPGLGAGASTAARLGAAAALGAGTAATQAVPGESEDFWKTKGVQALTGAALGPAMDVAGRALTTGAGKAAGAVRGRLTPEAQELTQLSARHGVPTHYSDIVQSRFAKRAEDVLEYTPFFGTAGSREAQQTAARKAAETVSDKLRNEMIATSYKGLNKVQQQAAAGNKAAVALQRELAGAGDDWNRIIQASGNLNLFRRKMIADKLYSEVSKKAAGKGWVDFKDTHSAIANQIARIEKDVVPDRELIRLLGQIDDRLNDPAVDISFEGARRLRSDLGDIISSYYKGADTLTGSKGVESLARIRNAVESDMARFAQDIGDPGVLQAWKKADNFYARNVIPFKDPALAKALKDAPPDEVFGKFITSTAGGGADRARRFYNALDPKGQSAVRYGMVVRALDNSVDEATGRFQPGKFAGALENLSKARGVVFKGQGKQELDGFTKLMRHIEAAGQQGQYSASAQQLMGTMASGAAAAVHLPLAVGGVATAGAARLLFTTEPGKRLLLAANLLKPGTSAMGTVLDRANRLLAASGGVAAGAEQGEPGRILP